MNKTRIVKETTNGGSEYFYVEDEVSYLLFFKRWVRPRKYSNVYNVHMNSYEAKQWIENRNKHFNELQKNRYNRKIAKIEVLDNED